MHLKKVYTRKAHFENNVSITATPDDYESEEDEDCHMDGIEDAQSESDSDDGNKNGSDDEEYDTVTVSEAAPDEQRYDQQMDLYEERKTMENIKSNDRICFSAFSRF